MPITSRANTILLVLILAVGVGVLAMLATGVRGGPLDPPGPVASTQSNVIYQPASCAGFPIVLSAPGSYRLGGNITGCADKNGIQIHASNVSLDLGGFSVIGVPTSLDGIKSIGAINLVNIANGGITGWGGDGLDVESTTASRIDHVSSMYNFQGAVLGTGSTFSDSTASHNSFDGVVSSMPDVMVIRCKAEFNTAGGVSLGGEGGIVDGCNARGNGGNGIGGGVAARLTNNHANYNGGIGIVSLHSCFIENNSASWNTYEGYFVWNPGQCTVVNNKATSNGRAGFYVYAPTGFSLIDSNHASGNGIHGFRVDAVTAGLPNIVTRNFAAGNVPTNYLIGANNDAAPVVAAGAVVNPMSNISQ